MANGQLPRCIVGRHPSSLGLVPDRRSQYTSPAWTRLPRWSVELHVENEKYYDFQPLLDELAEKLGSTFPGIRAERWTYGLRIVHELWEDLTGEEAAGQRASLVDATFGPIGDALVRLDPS